MSIISRFAGSCSLIIFADSSIITSADASRGSTKPLDNPTATQFLCQNFSRWPGLKLICRGTVEEKILRLQERKAAALGAAIGIDEQAPLMRGLDDDDLREVLEL